MTQLASASSAQLVYLEESTYGVVTAGAGKKLRMTGESLSFEIQTESTKEINDSRQVSDSIQVGATAQGAVNAELSYHEYDPFLEGILAGTFNTFGTNGVNALTVTIVKTAGTITDDGTDGFAGLVAGQWFSIDGDAGGNDGVYRIASRTDDVLTVDAATPLVADSASTTVDISSERLSNGTAAMRSFSIEKKFGDVSQFFMYKGMVPSKVSLTFNTGSIVTANFDFLGSASTRAGATAFTVPTATAAESYGVMNSVTGVGIGTTSGAGQILVRNGATELMDNTFVKSMTVNIDAKLRGQTAVGVFGNAGIGLGTFEMGGTLEVYLADGGVYDEAIAGNLISIQFPVKDVSGNGYAFVFDNCKLGVPTVTAGSMDTDVMLSIPFTAVAPNTTSDRMIHIDRFGVAVS